MTGEQTVTRTERALAAHADETVTAAYLFGSFATGHADANSDIDIGLLLTDDEPSTLQSRFGLEGAIESALGRTVQVTILNRAPPDLLHRVLRDGILLLDRNPETRIRFEVAARNAFFDLQPILHRYRHGKEAAHDR